MTNQQGQRKNAVSRETRSKRRVFRRTLLLMLLCGVGLFVPLIWQLWSISVGMHEDYQQRAVEQQTLDMSVSASRGTIYDAKGNVMAISATVYDLVLSPRDLVNSVNKRGFVDEDGKEDEAAYLKAIDEKRALIVDKISQVLDDVDREQLEKRILKTNSAYEVIRTKVDGEQADALRAFIAEYKLGYSLRMVPTTKRYYPFSGLAAQVLGFCNDEGGAYGLEARYNDVLEGSAGRVVTTRTGNGTEMYNGYSQYIDAQDGCDLHLTIDATIQSYAEKTLEEGIREYDVTAGGWCIVMNPKTGAVYAMASSPEYDPNQYASILDERLKANLEIKRKELGDGTEEYQKAASATLMKQWRSQAYMDTYEPGSTFKAVVLAAALEEGLVTESDTFYCSGAYSVAGYDKPISCSNKNGHQMQTLQQAVQHSCNPAFMQIGQRLGIERFYKYYTAFGLKELTGLDLPGEATNSSLIWPKDQMSGVDLAVASFGQRFQVSPIQMITAFSAVINGGNLMKPYVVDSVTDAKGNIVEKTQPTVVRQVVSAQTSQRASKILESVVSDQKDGTGKNAYQAGYRIGGKTGTSETSIPGEVVVSFMAFAPADDPEVVILLAYNTPARSMPGSNYGTTGVYISGGNMPAKKMGPLMAEVLDYLGVEKQYTADEAAMADVSVPGVNGQSLAEAKAALEKRKLSYRTVGEGDTVCAQVPSAGTRIPGGSRVILYLGEAKPEAQCSVPGVIGLSYETAKEKLEECGLFIRVSGSTASFSGSSRVESQSIAPGESATVGTVISVEFSAAEVSDGYVNVG